MRQRHVSGLSRLSTPFALQMPRSGKHISQLDNVKQFDILKEKLDRHWGCTPRQFSGDDMAIDKTRQEAFAQEWVDAWNSHDLDRILSLYSDDVCMQSEYIKAFANERSATLTGKQNLRAYWAEALSRLPDLHFTPILTCTGVETTAIHYQSVGGRLAIEVFRFNENGLVSQAAAHYA
jgi:hypothetical protein